MIEAYGVKGMKSTLWRRTFKNKDAMSKWVDKNDAEIYGTRETEEPLKQRSLLKSSQL